MMTQHSVHDGFGVWINFFINIFHDDETLMSFAVVSGIRVRKCI